MKSNTAKNVGKLIGGIKNIADKAIKRLFGIHSPSKVFIIKNTDTTTIKSLDMQAEHTKDR